MTVPIWWLTVNLSLITMGFTRSWRRKVPFIWARSGQSELADVVPVNNCNSVDNCCSGGFGSSEMEDINFTDWFSSTPSLSPTMSLVHEVLPAIHRLYQDRLRLLKMHKHWLKKMERDVAAFPANFQKVILHIRMLPIAQQQIMAHLRRHFRCPSWRQLIHRGNSICWREWKWVCRYYCWKSWPQPNFEEMDNAVHSDSLYTDDVADVDADRWIDLKIGNHGEPNQLLMNTGNHNLMQVEGALPQDSTYTEAIAVAGVDGDGRVDLILENYEQGDQLLRNAGNGAFKEVRGALTVSGLKKKYMDNRSWWRWWRRSSWHSQR